MKGKEGDLKQDKLKVRGAPGRCPFCKDLITDLNEVVACAACGARHHEACHSEHGACASCGEGQVLVSRTRARADVKARPPKGSRIRVKEEDTHTTYTWPGLSHQGLWLNFVLYLSMIVTIPVALMQLLRLGMSSQLKLGKKRLELKRVGCLTTKLIQASREDIGAVRLFRNQQGLMLTIDVGATRTAISSVGMGFPVLSEPEMEWLYAVLTAWKEAEE